MPSYLIDSHCHLHDPEFYTAEQSREFLDSAREQGVYQIICIGTNPADSLVARDFALNHDDVFWTYGIHPEYASNSDNTNGSTTHLLANSNPPEPPADLSTAVAIGEIGLDYHYEGYDRDAQIRLFEQMLQLARDHHLPVSLHIREAFADAFSVLDNFSGLQGVVHSFTGNKKELKAALSRDFYIGVNGLATYTTPPLPPLEKMLLETDAPFLTPEPFRGTMNVPGHIRTIANYLSGKMGVAEDLIAEQTTTNVRELFHLKPPVILRSGGDRERK